MTHTSRRLAVLVTVFALFAVSWSVASSQSGPTLTIGTVVCSSPCPVGTTVVVPINYVRNGNTISSMVFSVDFDQTRLWLDPTDADQDGTPDAIAFNLPSAFGGSAPYDPADTDGEIDFTIADFFPPLAFMPDRQIVAMTFEVVGSGNAPIVFSANPPPSFGDTNGQSVPGTAVNGSVVAIPLAVTLESFSAEAQADHIMLSWETVTEMNNQGFNLWRSMSPTEPRQQLNTSLIPSQAPGSTQGFAYRWRDYQVSTGQTYWYWLEDVDMNGAATLHGPVSATYNAPTAVTLTKLTASGTFDEVASWFLRQQIKLEAFLSRLLHR